MAVTKSETTANPMLAVRDRAAANPLATPHTEQSQAVQQREAQPMMFNPLVARGTPLAAPPSTPPTPTSPISSEPILADGPVVLPVANPLAVQAPVQDPVIQPEPPVVTDIPPPVESSPQIQAALDESSPERTLAPIQTPRNTEVNPRDRTRIKPLSGGNNGPVPTAMARAQSGSPGFLGFGRVSPSPKKSFTDLARKMPSRPGSEASGSRRTSPAASPYASPAASRQSSPSRRPSRRSSPANSRAGSPTKGRTSRPSSPSRASRVPSDVAARPPKQPLRATAPALAATAATAAAAAQLAPAQSTPPSDSWIDPQIPAQASGLTGQHPEARNQQAGIVESATAEKPFGAAALANFPPAKARAAAMRQKQEAQTGQQLQQQPFSISSHINRSAKEKAATVDPAAQATSSSARASSSQGLAIKAPPSKNPKARVMEDLRAAELARAIAPEPTAEAAPPSDAPPSKLAFGGMNASTGMVEQPKALTAKHFKALARQLEDNKPVEEALAIEASLSLAHLEQNTSMSRRSKGAAPETIAEAEPLQDPRSAADGNVQQEPMQSPFAAAAQGKFMPRMSAEDMTAMAMGAIDRIRGRAQQPDELPVELGPPRPDRGATRSLSLPKQGSSEDLSAIALAAIARLRNMADKAKESPRSSSAPRPERVSNFESEQERSARLRLPSGPARGSAVSAELMRTASPQPARAARSQRALQKPLSTSSQPEPSRQAIQSGTATPATPSTPERVTPDVAVASSPPSRSWSPDSAVPESTVVSAAEVAAQTAQPSGTSLAEVVNAPAADQFEPQRAQRAQPSADTNSETVRTPPRLSSPGEAASRIPNQQPAVPAEASDSGSDTSDNSIVVPPRQMVASRVVNLPSQPAAPPRSVAEVSIPSSPSTSSISSSVAEEEEEPYVFDEAAAAAKAKEKGKAVMSQPEIRPVRVQILHCQDNHCVSAIGKLEGLCDSCCHVCITA